MLMLRRFYQLYFGSIEPSRWYTAPSGRKDLSFRQPLSVGGPDDPRLQRAELLVSDPLEGVPELVPRQAQEPPLPVHVFRLHRQVGDLADLLLVDHLSFLVIGGLQDVA